MESGYMRMDFTRPNGYMTPDVGGSSSRVRKSRSFSVGSYVLPSAWSAPAGDDNAMLSGPIYHNLSTGPGPRRPPPPVPGGSDDKPPALPPRRFASSKSESFLLSRVDQTERDVLKDSYKNDNSSKIESGKTWESNTGTLKEDAYAQQLRKQARRYSEQHKPAAISMQVVSTKSTVQVSLSQSYKQERSPVLEAVPAQRHSPQSSQVHTDMKQAPSQHSPSLATDHRLSPDPPPMPTPMKNGEFEISSDLNTTADFPPPPPEFIEGTSEQKDRCADDSYGSYKTQATREVGKYKRTTSDTSVLRFHPDHKPFRPLPDFEGKDLLENTPSKPPRKKLELGTDSPKQSNRSNSPNMLGGNSQRGMPQVPAYQPPEVSSVSHAQKMVAKPLHGQPTQKLNTPLAMPGSSGSFVGTVVQRPAMSPDDHSTQASDEANRPSVKDRVKNIEVFSHSPGSSKPNVQRSVHPASAGEKLASVSVQPQSTDSLEQLESTTRNDSFRDRLRPVIKKTDDDCKDDIGASQADMVTQQPWADNAESVKGMPPMVPNRTYKQQTGWKDQYANRGPKPYGNKSNSSANIHSPVGSNKNTNNYKTDSVPEPKRSPSHSVPEPQVPSRSSKPSWGSDNLTQDQNSSISSQDSRSSNHGDDLLPNKDNTKVHSSVHSGQKRNYDKSFSRTRHSSGGSSSHADPHSAGNVQNWRSGNTQSDKLMGSNSHRSDFKGDNYSEQKHGQQIEQRSAQSRYNHSPTQRLQSSDQSHSNMPNTETDNQPPASIPRNETVEMKQNSALEANSQTMLVVNHIRQPSAEELECDQKAQELAKVLKDSDKQLCDVLTSDSKKNRMQYLDGIFPTTAEGTEEHRPRSGTKSDKPVEEKPEEKEEPTSPMPSNYYVSPPKAMIELEIRKLTDSNQLAQDLADNDTLALRKEELLQSMLKKVDVLKEDKKELLTDIEDNEALGRQVGGYIEKKCRSQQEKDKFKSYIEDIDKIIRLLLKLSGLLARAENTIQGLTESTNEKVRKMTFDKRDRLFRQHEDAKELKLDIDRRSQQLEEILQGCLSQSELDDYHVYIKMKSKYTIQMQELEDKITLGQEQITALQKSIPDKK